MTLPHCTPVLNGWTPIFLSQVEATYRVGIWQQTSSEQISDETPERSVVLFANDYRCGSGTDTDPRYSVLLSGPARWRYAEVRDVHHSGASVGLASEIGPDGSVTVALLGLNEAPLPQ